MTQFHKSRPFINYKLMHSFDNASMTIENCTREKSPMDGNWWHIEKIITSKNKRNDQRNYIKQLRFVCFFVVVVCHPSGYCRKHNEKRHYLRSGRVFLV